LSDFAGRGVGELPDNDRHGVELRQLRRAEPALAGDDLKPAVAVIFPVGRANHERLQDAVGSDGFG